MLIFKWFFVIYNAYYKDGTYKNDIPPLTVGVLFLFVIVTLSMSMYTLIDLVIHLKPYQTENVKVIKHLYVGRKPLSIKELIGLSLASYTTYLLFFRKHKYVDIYVSYKNDKFLNSYKAKIIGFSMIILCYASPFILSIIKNKVLLGRPF